MIKYCKGQSCLLELLCWSRQRNGTQKYYGTILHIEDVPIPFLALNGRRPNCHKKHVNHPRQVISTMPLGVDKPRTRFNERPTEQVLPLHNPS